MRSKRPEEEGKRAIRPYATRSSLDDAQTIAELQTEIERLNGRVEGLERLGKRLLEEYDKEQEEYGFPFNFALRDAHREFRAALSPGEACEG